MSLHQEEIGTIPEETARVAKAVFRRGNLCLRLRDALGSIYDNQAFADLFPKMGRPAEAPWRLALVCILQYVEDLSDRQAAEAVRQTHRGIPAAQRGNEATSAGGADRSRWMVPADRAINGSLAPAWLRPRPSRRAPAQGVGAAVLHE